MHRHLSLAGIDPQESSWDPQIDRVWHASSDVASPSHTILPAANFWCGELPLSLTGQTLSANPFYPYAPVYQACLDDDVALRREFAHGRGGRMYEASAAKGSLKGKMEHEFYTWLQESGAIGEVVGLMHLERDALSKAV